MSSSAIPYSLILGLIFFSATAGPATAQTKEGHTAGYNAIIDNLDLLVDNYARFLGRKYDLTEEQDEYTKYLLRERCYEFLDNNEEDLRRLVDRMFDVRTGGEMSQEELIEWGRQVQPIYEHAKNLIVQGNNEWREILTEQQREIHDEDLRMMFESFETTEDQLQRIVTGQMTIEEFRNPSRRNRSAARRQPRTSEPSQQTPTIAEQPPIAEPAPPPPPPRRAGPPSRAAAEREGRVKRPDESGPAAIPMEPVSEARRAARERARRGRQPSAPSPGTEGPEKDKQPESEWAKYVREFIEKYQLNDEQAQKAHAVLEDCEAQAERYMHGRKTHIEKLDRQIEELKKSSDKNKAKNLAAFQERRKKLTAPVDQIFEQQLKPRLERLPTRAQRRAAEEAEKKKVAKKPSRKTSAQNPANKNTPGKED